PLALNGIYPPDVADSDGAGLVNDPVEAARRRRLPKHLRSYLLDRLPDYMVPAIIMVVDSFPVTSNGKLDRRALPKPDLAARTPAVATGSQPERILCELFAEVL